MLIKKRTRWDSEKRIEGDVIMVRFQNISSSNVQLMKAIKTLHPMKYIFASSPENKVPFD